MSGRALDYGGGRAESYHAVRTLAPELLAAWKAALTRAVELRTGDRRADVLDLGAGTGQFTPALADWFGARVVAVEPSEAMRAQAAAAGIDGLVAGRAEAIPLRADAVDLAWLSTVIHQFEDRTVALRELRRVLRGDGVIAVRGYFADQGPISWFAHFPGIERSIARFPTTEQVLGELAGAGFADALVLDVDERWRFSPRRYEQHVRRIRHADSMLAPLTDDEIEAGLASIRAAHSDPDQEIQALGALRLLVVH